jgi:hypothetical protein
LAHDPPQFSFELPAQGMLHADDRVEFSIVALPQKHQWRYCTPANANPRDRQLLTQVSTVIGGLSAHLLLGALSELRQ